MALLWLLPWLQIDNQLVGRYHPVLLFVTPHTRNDDDEDKGPALHISINKVANQRWNADIYKVQLYKLLGNQSNIWLVSCRWCGQLLGVQNSQIFNLSQICIDQVICRAKTLLFRL